MPTTAKTNHVSDYSGSLQSHTCPQFRVHFHNNLDGVIIDPWTCLHLERFILCFKTWELCRGDGWKSPIWYTNSSVQSATIGLRVITTVTACVMTCANNESRTPDHRWDSSFIPMWSQLLISRTSSTKTNKKFKMRVNIRWVYAVHSSKERHTEERLNLTQTNKQTNKVSTCVMFVAQFVTLETFRSFFFFCYSTPLRFERNRRVKGEWTSSLQQWHGRRELLPYKTGDTLYLVALRLLWSEKCKQRRSETVKKRVL